MLLRRLAEAVRYAGVRRLAGDLPEGNAAMRRLLPDQSALRAGLLHRVNTMVKDIPEIAELDLNPVFVRQHGAVVADVRVRLAG